MPPGDSVEPTQGAQTAGGSSRPSQRRGVRSGGSARDHLASSETRPGASQSTGASARGADSVSAGADSTGGEAGSAKAGRGGGRGGKAGRGRGRGGGSRRDHPAHSETPAASPPPAGSDADVSAKQHGAAEARAAQLTGASARGGGGADSVSAGADSTGGEAGSAKAGRGGGRGGKAGRGRGRGFGAATGESIQRAEQPSGVDAQGVAAPHTAFSHSETASKYADGLSSEAQDEVMQQTDPDFHNRMAMQHGIAMMPLSIPPQQFQQDQSFYQNQQMQQLQGAPAHLPPMPPHFSEAFLPPQQLWQQHHQQQQQQQYPHQEQYSHNPQQLQQHRQFLLHHLMMHQQAGLPVPDLLRQQLSQEVLLRQQQLQNLQLQESSDHQSAPPLHVQQHLHQHPNQRHHDQQPHQHYQQHWQQQPQQPQQLDTMLGGAAVPPGMDISRWLQAPRRPAAPSAAAGDSRDEFALKEQAQVPEGLGLLQAKTPLTQGRSPSRSGQQSLQEGRGGGRGGRGGLGGRDGRGSVEQEAAPGILPTPGGRTNALKPQKGSKSGEGSVGARAKFLAEVKRWSLRARGLEEDTAGAAEAEDAALRDLAVQQAQLYDKVSADENRLALAAGERVGRGLDNPGGETNCLVNVVIQSLAQLPRFPAVLLRAAAQHAAILELPPWDGAWCSHTDAIGPQGVLLFSLADTVRELRQLHDAPEANVPGAAAAAKQGTNEWMTVPTRKAQLHGSGSTPGGGKGIGHDTGLGGPGEGDADGEKHPLWTFLKRAQDKAVRVGQCRSALGAIVAARNRPGEAGDAATTLGDVLTALEESLSPFAGDSDSPVADTFQLRMRCVSCGEQAEQPSFVHTVSAAVLRRAASPARGQGPEAMMRQACVAPEPPCPNCSRGSRRVLDAPPPPILALAIRWDAPASSSQETRAVLARLPRCMDLAAVLDSDAPGSALYRLRAMWCYSGAHCVLVAYSARAQQFVLYDDWKVLPLGGPGSASAAWSALGAKCISARLRPHMVFYERL